MAGEDPGTLMSQVPGVIPVIKPTLGDLSALVALLGGERVTFSSLDRFLGLEPAAVLSVSFLGVNVASVPALLSVEAEPTTLTSPTRDPLLGGPGVATELPTLILL